MVVLDSEIGNAVQIQSISFKRSTFGVDTATFADLNIYMGHGTADQLNPVFLNNYLPGTRTQVFDSGGIITLTAGMNEWFTINLDTPYWYSGVNNLIIEFEWPSDEPSEGSLYIWHWQAGTNRAIFGPFGSTTADEFETTVPHLRLNGNLELQTDTFGSIKARFAED